MVKSFFEGKGKGKNRSSLFIAISVVLCLIAGYLIYKNSKDEKFTTTPGQTTTTAGRLCANMVGGYGYDGKQDLCQCDHKCQEGRGGCCSDKEKLNPYPTDMDSVQRGGARGHTDAEGVILGGVDSYPEWLHDNRCSPYVKCGEYIKNYVTGNKKACQCDQHCKGHKDCCEDYDEVCKATTPTPTS